MEEAKEIKIQEKQQTQLSNQREGSACQKQQEKSDEEVESQAN